MNINKIITLLILFSAINCQAWDDIATNFKKETGLSARCEQDIKNKTVTVLIDGVTDDSFLASIDKSTHSITIKTIAEEFTITPVPQNKTQDHIKTVLQKRTNFGWNSKSMSTENSVPGMIDLEAIYRMDQEKKNPVLANMIVYNKQNKQLQITLPFVAQEANVQQGFLKVPVTVK
jgi:hypothetical protein